MIILPAQLGPEFILGAFFGGVVVSVLASLIASAIGHDRNEGG